MSIVEILDTMDYGPAPEARDHADAWLARHADGFGLFIGGTWRAAKSGESLAAVNPANGRPLGSVAQAGKADVGVAVRAGRAAQGGWAALGGHGRARHLYALARLVQKNARLLAVV
ncbi:MAG TPA: aldehyde dehydrogenase family protein, partial [Kiloniellales bacterium]